MPRHEHTAAFGRAAGAELRNPDFGKLAQAFGVAGASVSSPDELEGVLKKAIADGGPWLIEARVGDMPSAWHLNRMRPAAEPARDALTPADDNTRWQEFARKAAPVLGRFRNR